MVLEYYLHSNHEEYLTVEHFQDYIISAIVSHIEDDSYEDAIRHMINALFAIERNDSDVSISVFNTGKEAETQMMDLYLKMTGDDPDNSGWLWPSPLPHKNNLPKKICSIVTRALAEKHIAERKAYYEHVRKQEHKGRE